MRLTASNLATAINQLPHDREYTYINPRNKGRIIIENVVEPEGPIQIKRYNPSNGEIKKDAKRSSISTDMLWRLANALGEDVPVDVNVVFGASYNTRSALESLLAHSPQFFFCKPGRIQFTNNRREVKKGNKHIVYRPNDSHENGVLKKTDVIYDISALSHDVIQRGIELDNFTAIPEMTIVQKREHVRIQIALVLIGQQLGFRTWVAQNDHGVECEGKRLVEMDGVIDRLSSEQVISSYPKGVEAAKFIDCIWFRNGKLMPAVMEIEHSTGINSGLSRMKGFYDVGPQLRDIRWTIVAPDDDRERVLKKAQAPQFSELKTKYFPYSAVMELYSLCERRKIKGVNDEFLDCFMEDCCPSSIQ